MKDTRQSCSLLLALCEDLDTPFSLGVYLLAKYGELDQLTQLSVAPDRYLDTSLGAYAYLKDTQACDFLRKFPDFNLGFDLKEDACTQFSLSERACFETNRRLYKFIDNTGLSGSDISLWPFIQKVREMVLSILGGLPQDIDIRFGPGSTFELSGKKSTFVTTAEKIESEVTITPSCLDLLPFIYGTSWGRAVINSDRSAPSIVPGNRFTSVPKTARKDRGICIEPGGNVSLQLGVGRHIKSRLKKAGLDLEKGQDIHRHLAKLASINGLHATIDLSNASDTISCSLVELLLPEHWFQLLDSLRSPKTLIQGKWVVLEKFSSMGNGFTFELESLIFHALASTFYGAFVPTFGDDMIVPNKDIPSFVNMLEFFGLEVNMRKSYWTGSFRESCGGDFFLGYPVRGYYLKNDPQFPAHWFSVHNGLLRSSRQIGMTYRRALAYIFHQIPLRFRGIRGPDIFGDIVLTDRNSDNWDSHTTDCIRYITSLQPVSTRLALSKRRSDVQLACVLYGTAEGSSSLLDWLNRGLISEKYQARVDSGFLSPRQIIRRWKIKHVPFS